MERYDKLRQLLEEAYSDYQVKLEEYNLEYEKYKNYVIEHKSCPKELREKATICSDARAKANGLWNKCVSHPMHFYFKGYKNPPLCRYGIQ